MQTGYYVYIIECLDGTLYTGITTDVRRRLAEHKAGVGGHYTRAHGALKVVYSEMCDSRSEASNREAVIKKLSRKAKLDLIQ